MEPYTVGLQDPEESGKEAGQGAVYSDKEAGQGAVYSDKEAGQGALYSDKEAGQGTLYSDTEAEAGADLEDELEEELEASFQASLAAAEVALRSGGEGSKFSPNAKANAKAEGGGTEKLPGSFLETPASKKHRVADSLSTRFHSTSAPPGPPQCPLSPLQPPLSQPLFSPRPLSQSTRASAGPSADGALARGFARGVPRDGGSSAAGGGAAMGQPGNASARLSPTISFQFPGWHVDIQRGASSASVSVHRHSTRATHPSLDDEDTPGVPRGPDSCRQWHDSNLGDHTPLLSLPSEILYRVLLRLRPRDLCMLRLSCSALYRSAGADCLWERHVARQVAALGETSGAARCYSFLTPPDAALTATSGNTTVVNSTVVNTATLSSNSNNTDLDARAAIIPLSVTPSNISTNAGATNTEPQPAVQADPAVTAVTAVSGVGRLPAEGPTLGQQWCTGNSQAAEIPSPGLGCPLALEYKLREESHRVGAKFQELSKGFHFLSHTFERWWQELDASTAAAPATGDTGLAAAATKAPVTGETGLAAVATKAAVTGDPGIAAPGRGETGAPEAAEGTKAAVSGEAPAVAAAAPAAAVRAAPTVEEASTTDPSRIPGETDAAYPGYADRDPQAGRRLTRGQARRKRAHERRTRSASECQLASAEWGMARQWECERGDSEMVGSEDAGEDNDALSQTESARVKKVVRKLTDCDWGLMYEAVTHVFQHRVELIAHSLPIAPDPVSLTSPAADPAPAPATGPATALSTDNATALSTDQATAFSARRGSETGKCTEPVTSTVPVVVASGTTTATVTAAAITVATGTATGSATGSGTGGSKSTGASSIAGTGMASAGASAPGPGRTATTHLALPSAPRMPNAEMAWAAVGEWETEWALEGGSGRALVHQGYTLGDAKGTLGGASYPLEGTPQGAIGRTRSPVHLRETKGVLGPSGGGRSTAQGTEQGSPDRSLTWGKASGLQHSALAPETQGAAPGTPLRLLTASGMRREKRGAVAGSGSSASVCVSVRADTNTNTSVSTVGVGSGGGGGTRESGAALWREVLRLWSVYRRWIKLVSSHCMQLQFEVMLERARGQTGYTSTPTVYDKGVVCFRSCVLLSYSNRRRLQQGLSAVLSSPQDYSYWDQDLFNLKLQIRKLYQELDVSDDRTLSEDSFTQQKFRRCFGMIELL